MKNGKVQESMARVMKTYLHIQAQSNSGAEIFDLSQHPHMDNPIRI